MQRIDKWEKIDMYAKILTKHNTTVMENGKVCGNVTICDKKPQEKSTFRATARPHGTRPHGTLFLQIHYFGLGTKISEIHCFLSSLLTSRYSISRNV